VGATLLFPFRILHGYLCLGPRGTLVRHDTSFLLSPGTYAEQLSSGPVESGGGIHLPSRYSLPDLDQRFAVYPHIAPLSPILISRFFERVAGDGIESPPLIFRENPCCWRPAMSPDHSVLLPILRMRRYHALSFLLCPLSPRRRLSHHV